MAERRDDSHDDNDDKATPGVMGGAAAVGVTVGAIVGGPLTALALGVGAAGLTLSDGKVIDVWLTQGVPVVWYRMYPIHRLQEASQGALL